MNKTTFYINVGEVYVHLVKFRRKLMIHINLNDFECDTKILQHFTSNFVTFLKKRHFVYF
jgi:hypothetical protein